MGDKELNNYVFEYYKEKGMLLVLDGGIFYEFIPANEFYDENPTRISLKDVQLGVNYVIILNYHNK